jgi:hypothetical protein
MDDFDTFEVPDPESVEVDEPPYPRMEAGDE